MASSAAPAHHTRRRFLAWAAVGAGLVAVGGVTGVELIAHHVLPGQGLLDRVDGACDVADHLSFAHPAGPQMSGTFRSAARRTTVGYTVAWPPGHRPGDRLPLVVMLHGFGGNHVDALQGITPAQALALAYDGQPLKPMAVVTVDGGGGYWNPHPGDDPMAMVVDELIPMCQRLGLGQPGDGGPGIATMGISMGGYGAILLAERYPAMIKAVAAISPAVWTSYDQARQANPGAYASAADFAADDVVTHTSALSTAAIRVAVGDDDPFRPGVTALARQLPPDAIVVQSAGCHTRPFFAAQEPPSLAFLGRHLGT